MAIVINSATSDCLFITEDGDAKVAPRRFLNQHYSQLIGGNLEDVSRDGVQYKAFPFSNIIGGYFVILYSDGDAHASSDRQIMARKPAASILDNSTAWEQVTFFENSSAVFNFSLLTDIMTNGESFLFKVWTVTKTAGVVAQSTLSSSVVSGFSDSDIDGNYAMWSKSRLYAGNYYRVGYSFAGAEWNSVLFESADQITWAIKGFIAKGIGAGLKFSEADIVETTSGNYLAVIREDSGTGRPLYTSTSTNLITWTTPVLSTEFEGTQPNLIKLSSGSILLSVGDRVGSSGLDFGGVPSNFPTVTGIKTYISTNNASTFSVGTNFDLSWSTDCGQPMMEEVLPGFIAMSYYNSLKQTNSVTEPGIRNKVFTAGNVL